LADVVGGYDTLSRAIIHDDHGVALLPCGDRKNWRADSLMSAAVRDLIDDLKTRFDYVLIDCAPVLKGSDAETVAGIVDQVTMIVATAKTSKKELQKAGATLRKFSKEVPSVILNRADLKNVA
jgi:Mrp family chromosome partitioning ATPase